MNVHASRPIANGICFDDAAYLQDETVTQLTALGLLFVSTFRNPSDDRHYGGVILAASWDAAQAVADGRGLGEVIEGQLVRRISDAR